MAGNNYPFRRMTPVAAPFEPENCPICGAGLPSMRCSQPLGLFQCENCQHEIEPAWGPKECIACGCERDGDVGYFLDVTNSILCGCCNATLGSAPFRKS